MNNNLDIDLEISEINNGYIVDSSTPAPPESDDCYIHNRVYSPNLEDAKAAVREMLEVELKKLEVSNV